MAFTDTDRLAGTDREAHVLERGRIARRKRNRRKHARRGSADIGA